MAVQGTERAAHDKGMERGHRAGEAEGFGFSILRDHPAKSHLPHQHQPGPPLGLPTEVMPFVPSLQLGNLIAPYMHPKPLCTLCAPKSEKTST